MAFDDVPDRTVLTTRDGSMSGPDLTPAVLAEVGSRIAAAIAREGSYEFGTHCGFLLCR